MTQPEQKSRGCAACRDGKAFDFEFSMAFQPIIDIKKREVFAHEALVRAKGSESAAEVFEHVNEENRYAFDQACRVKAISLAAKLGMKSALSINFMPNAVYQPEACIQTTLKAAVEHQFPIEQIMFEVTESEKVKDLNHLANIFDYYRKRGFVTALDDFGAGYSGLNMLADLDVDVLKLDMYLVRDIDTNAKKQALLHGVLASAKTLNIRVIAEGVETQPEFATLRDMGIDLYQGYLFAKPQYEALPDINWGAASDTVSAIQAS